MLKNVENLKNSQNEEENMTIKDLSSNLKLFLNNEWFVHENTSFFDESRSFSNFQHFFVIFVFTAISAIFQFRLRVTNMTFRDDHDSRFEKHEFYDWNKVSWFFWRHIFFWWYCESICSSRKACNVNYNDEICYINRE